VPWLNRDPNRRSLDHQLYHSLQATSCVGRRSSFASQTLTTMSLDLATSAPIAEFTQIPSIVEFPEDAHLASSDTSGSARVVWFEHGRIRTVYLGKSGQLGGVKDLLPGKGRVYKRILNASARDQGWILGQMKNGEVDAIDVREGGKIVTTFEASRDSDDKSTSVYSAAKTKEGVVFNRVYWSFTHNWAVFEALSLSPKGELLSSGYSFAFDTAAHGVILNVAGSSNIVPATLRSSSQIPSIVITTSSGAIQLVTPETIKWTREESLSEIAAVRFVDLGEPEVEEARHLMADETFAARLTRHISELKVSPGQVQVQLAVSCSRVLLQLTADTSCPGLAGLPRPIRQATHHRLVHLCRGHLAALPVPTPPRPIRIPEAPRRGDQRRQASGHGLCERQDRLGEESRHDE
jgi:hypothetical protein